MPLTHKSTRENGGVYRWNICYLIDSLNIGGSESQMVQVACRLKSKGHALTVGCLRLEGLCVEQLRSAEIPVYEFPIRGGLLRAATVHQFLRLVHFLRAGKFDVVHSHDLYSNLVGIPAACLARTRVVISSRRDLASWWWYTPRNHRVLRYVQSLSDQIVANSNCGREFLVTHESVKRDKIRVIRNGVRVEEVHSRTPNSDQVFPGSYSTRRVVTVANMHVNTKGHSYLIDAASRICQSMPVTFVLIGDGPLRPELERQVREAGLSDKFLFLGQRADVPSLLAHCDVFVLPSLSEGLPNVVLEALAAGLPVVATRVGGTPEIIRDGIDGLLVEPRDPKALADGIVRILSNPGLARSLLEAGRERVRTDFSFDRVISELEQLYQDCGKREGDRLRLALPRDARYCSGR